jgi:hypothetical protein
MSEFSHVVRSNTNEECFCSGIEQACGCEKDCWYQDYLILNGFVESCDFCGKAGSTESNGWIGVVSDQGMCSVFCSRKCAGEENYKIYEAAQKVVDSRSTR